MAATVVWCNSCKTAVWAYDQMRYGQDIRGFLNMIKMPCPKCGVTGNFDGWSGDDEAVRHLIDTFPGEVYDRWSALKKIMRLNTKDYTWAISPDCTWFKRPEDEMQSDEFPVDLTEDVADLIKERYNNNLAIQRLNRTWKEMYESKE